MDNFEAITSKLFKPCSSKEYSELWIMEGDSAIGGFEGFRDHRFQAGFKLKGNPKNVYGCTPAEVLANPEFKALTRALGCGMFNDFNIKKLQFDKIIIFVDSDIDGYNMTSLLSAYFLWCMPEIVQKGYLYKAMAPLYILKDSKHPYLVSKIEYYELFADTVVKNVKLIDENNHELTKAEMKKLITANKDYLDELETLSQYFYINHELIEFTVLNFEKPNFEKLLKKKFPEMSYDKKTNIMSGVHNMAYQYVSLGKTFMAKCHRLYEYIHDTNNGKIYYKAINKNDDKPELISLGTFFITNKKYLPAIDERIKGIGELPGEVLWETTLNPVNRELKRLTCFDLARELENVNILHGKNPALRKQLMAEYVLNKDDIDT